MAWFFGKSRKGTGMRRSTLVSLMHMDTAQLSDMGLTHHDVAEALRQRSASAGSFLSSRRNARAAEWLR